MCVWNFSLGGPCQLEHPSHERLRCTLTVGHGGAHNCDGIDWAHSLTRVLRPPVEGAAPSVERFHTQVCPNCRRRTLDVYHSPIPTWMHSDAGRLPERVECSADCGITREQLHQAGLDTLGALLSRLP